MGSPWEVDGKSLVGSWQVLGAERSWICYLIYCITIICNVIWPFLRFSSWAEPILGLLAASGSGISGASGPCRWFFSWCKQLINNNVSCFFRVFEKNILWEWKMVVFLQPFSTWKRELKNERDLKWWEERDSVCQSLYKRYDEDTKTSQRGKRRT